MQMFVWIKKKGSFSLGKKYVSAALKDDETYNVPK